MNQESPQPILAITRMPAAYQAEAVRRLFMIHKQGLPFVPVLTLAIGWGLWPYTDHNWLLIWFAVWFVLMPGGLYILTRRYAAANVAPQEAALWGKRLTIITTLEGVMCGIGGIFFFSADAAVAQTILLVFLVGKVSGALFSTSWWPASFYGSVYTSMLMTVGGLLILHPQFLALSIGLLAFVGGIHMVMRAAHTVAVETIALKFEKEDLIEQLNQEKTVAENANRDKSRFLAAASHDLRQPIHALTLFVAALKSRLGNSALRDMTEQIHRCTGALESLLQTLLDISRIDANTVVPQPCDFHLQPLVERLRAEHEMQAAAAGLTLRAACPPLTVYSDPALLDAILRNLLSNALRYTHSGSVTLFAETHGATVIVGVRDTGIGIAPEKQIEIFHEFVQLANPERDRSKGLGLGLAIVQRLSRLLDSHTVVESAPQRGATFYLSLPAGNAAAVRAETAPLAVSNLLADSIVVVIDDEADIRRGMEILLGDWGCRVFAAENADDAIRQLDAQNLRPDLAVSDYRLRNGSTGVDAVRQLQARFGDLPCAIITGDTAREPLNQVQASGLPLLHKPVQPAKLRALLLSLKRSQSVTR